MKDLIKVNNEGIAGCIAEGPGGFIHCINDNTNMDVYGIILYLKQIGTFLLESANNS